MRVEMTDATAPLSAYARKARREPVVVTLHGKPVVVVRPLTKEEWEDLVVSTDPNFIEIMKRSRAQAKAGQTISLQDLKRKYRVKPKALRRGRRRAR
jgi:prevent-host-death family protein